MKAQEKANKLVDDFINATQIFIEYPEDKSIQKSVAVSCSKICVQEIIDDSDASSPFEEQRLKYWQEVLNHLNEM